MFADPCDEEEPLLENFFTVVCCLNRDDLSVYKQGGSGLDVGIIQEAFGITKGRYDQVAPDRRFESVGDANVTSVRQGQTGGGQRVLV